MLKSNLVLFILSVLLCVVHGWRVFPLPNAPAPATVSAVKPTPVFAPVASTTGAYSPASVAVKPTSVLEPALTSGGVPEPSKDLLPPKV